MEAEAEVPTRQQKVVYLINSLAPGGAEMGLEFLCRSGLFDGVDLTVVLLSSDGGPLEARMRKRLGGHLVVLAGGRTTPVSLLIRLRRLLNRLEPDTVIASLTRAVLLSRLMKRGRRWRLVTFEHNTRYGSSLAERAMRATDHLTDVFWCDSFATQQALAERVAGTPSTLVPLFSLDPSAPIKRSRQPDGDFRIASVGRLNSQKAHHRAIETLSRLRQQGVRATLEIFGDGELRGDLVEQAQKLCVDEHLTLWGHHQRWLLEAADCDAYLLMSEYEGLSIATLEAMGAGLPCVVRPVGEIAHYATDGQTALIVDSVDDAVAALVSLAHDPELAAGIARRGRARVQHEYSRDALAAHIREARESIGVGPALRGPRVLIRTFPPTTNANYGGILQAWAMQRVLTDVGCAAYVDSTRSDQTNTMRRRLLALVRPPIAAAVPWRMTPAPLRERVYDEYLNRNLLQFASEEVDMVALHNKSGKIDSQVLSGFDAFVVGSDQVWRPVYAPVESNLLDFLPDTFTGPRVAYAASFGTDRPEYDETLRRSTSKLARKLTAVSVREDTGVELCRQLWGVEAVQMPDPTLLVEADEYRELARRGTGVGARGRLLVHVLDSSAAVRSAVDSLSTALAAPVRWVSPVLAAVGVSLFTRATEFVRPGIREWLGLISSAGWVLTDSFHGCVFSVIFERQFLVVLNEQRGATRFRSFLSMVGLMDRIVDPEGDIGEQMRRPIDWAKARGAIAAARQEARKFLVDALLEPRLRG